MPQPQKRSTHRLLGVLALSLMLVSAGCGEAKKVELSGQPIEPPFSISGARLQATTGGDIHLDRLDRKFNLVFFGYTNCPDICSAVMASMSSGLAKLSAAQRRDVGVIFVTTDPRRDTPAKLKEYLGRFGKDLTGVTGQLSTIASVAKSVGIYVDQGELLKNGKYDPNSHSTYVIGVRDSGKAPVLWNADTSPSEFAQDVSRLLAQS